MANTSTHAITQSQEIYDVIITPGPKGSFHVRNTDGDYLISIGSDKTITVLGETFSLELIKEWLSNFKSDACRCTLTQLMHKGCDCGGS